jgi:hypothetical protein
MAPTKRPPAPTGGKQRSFRPSPSVSQPLGTSQRGPQLTANDLQALPILRSPEKEAELVRYVLDRVQMSDEERRRRAQRAQDIDVQISGYISPKAEDRKRRRENKGGKDPKPTNMSLPLAGAQIDECVTYMMSVFAPEMDFFEAVAPADKQIMAQAVVAQLNQHSQKAQYYRHISRMSTAAIRYNFGGLTCNWEKVNGITFKGKPGGVADKVQDTVWEGNLLQAIDVYNFGYDTAVHPVDLALEGEFFWEVERITPFRARRMAKDGMLFGINRFVGETIAQNAQNSMDGKLFYFTPPSVRDDTGFAQSETNWVSLLRASNVQESAPGLEIVRYTGWINPKQLGLGNTDELQVWRLKIVNGRYLAHAVKLDDTHGMLPVAIAAPLEDDLKNEQRTHAEMLIPLQQFASFLMNSHQAAHRKAIYGVTVFNPQFFPGLDVDAEDLASAVIPTKSSATLLDIDKVFRHYQTAPNTGQNVQDIGNIIQLMQKILPTDMLQQVADLERATVYQAAATVQAGNRRQLKIARMISDQCLNVIKFQMIYNLYSNMQSISYVDPNGVRTTIQVGDLVDAGIEYEIGTGLKGIDRLITVQIIRDVLNGIIQSQQAIAEFDIVSLLNYFATLAGDKTDLRQFRRGASGMSPAQASQPGGAQVSPGATANAPAGPPNGTGQPTQATIANQPGA